MQSSTCFEGILELGFEDVRVVETLYMSKRVETCLFLHQKFCIENTLIFDTFGKGFAKIV